MIPWLDPSDADAAEHLRVDPVAVDSAHPMERRLTGAGAFLLLATILLLSRGAMRGSMIELEIASILLGHLAGAALFTWLGLRGLRCAVRLPVTAHARSPRKLRVLVENAGFATVLEPELRFMIPRTLDRAVSLPPSIPPGSVEPRELDVTFSTRGRFEDGWIVVTVRSFGLIVGRRILYLPIDLLVFPAVELIDRRPAPPGSLHTQVGERTLDRSGRDVEIIGIREYQPGDSPRHIDWRAFARCGQLHVKEFSRTSEADVTLAMDFSGEAPGWTPATEDAYVTVAASLLFHLHQRQQRTQLIMVGDSTTIVPYGTGNHHHASLQTCLALGRRRADSRLIEALELEGRALTPGTLLVVLATPESGGTALLRGLGGLGLLGVRPVLVLFEPGPGTGPGEGTGSPEAAPAGVRVIRLDRTAVLEPVLEAVA